MDYTGIREVSLTQEELAQFYQGDFPILDLLENQYVFLRDETGKIVDKFFWREGHLERVPFIIFSSDFVGKINRVIQSKNALFIFCMTKILG